MENKNLKEQKKSVRIYRVVILTVLTALIVTLLVIALTPNTLHKPAIYLYPENTSEIKITLDRSIKYNNVIPKYRNGWKVIAKPNGEITDLQPQYTNCEKLPHNTFGFEYAYEACMANKYPYIYWDGVRLLKFIPEIDEGWVIKKENIHSFLISKAEELGFNNAESEEFIRYWTTKIRSSQGEYFKIYFLQNEDVDDYMPIYVKPFPDSSNRIQIIVRKVDEPEEGLIPQNLIKIKREGFTLVEWGGILMN